MQYTIFRKGKINNILFPDDLPERVDTLSRETIDSLRKTTQTAPALYGELNPAQQASFTQLAELCLSELTGSPTTARLLEKFGPQENVYVVKIAQIGGTVLRLHYYSKAGVCQVDRAELRQAPVNTAKVGTPHCHRGDCAAVISRGTLVHHLFQEARGDEYTAGRIDFAPARNPVTGTQSLDSTFVPQAQTGLQYTASKAVGSRRGYWMHHKAVHAVTWPEPALSIFFNDVGRGHQSTVYHQAAVQTKIERPRHLTEDERSIAWDSLVKLAQSKN